MMEERGGTPRPVLTNAEDVPVRDPMLRKLLNAMERTAGYSHTGYLLNGLTGPGPFAAPANLAPVWHPDLRLQPPLSRRERETFERLTAWF